MIIKITIKIKNKNSRNNASNELRFGWTLQNQCFFLMLKNSKLGLNLYFKGPLLSLRQYLATESHLKMIKNAFYFTLKALSLEIFKYLS